MQIFHRARSVSRKEFITLELGYWMVTVDFLMMKMGCAPELLSHGEDGLCSRVKRVSCGFVNKCLHKLENRPVFCDELFPLLDPFQRPEAVPTKMSSGFCSIIAYRAVRSVVKHIRTIPNRHCSTRFVTGVAYSAK